MKKLIVKENINKLIYQKKKLRMVLLQSSIQWYIKNWKKQQLVSPTWQQNNRPHLIIGLIYP